MAEFSLFEAIYLLINNKLMKLQREAKSQIFLMMGEQKQMGLLRYQMKAVNGNDLIKWQVWCEPGDSKDKLPISSCYVCLVLAYLDPNLGTTDAQRVKTSCHCTHQERESHLSARSSTVINWSHCSARLGHCCGKTKGRVKDKAPQPTRRLFSSKQVGGGFQWLQSH